MTDTHIEFAPSIDKIWNKNLVTNIGDDSMHVTHEKDFIKYLMNIIDSGRVITKITQLSENEYNVEHSTKKPQQAMSKSVKKKFKEVDDRLDKLEGLGDISNVERVEYSRKHGFKPMLVKPQYNTLDSFTKDDGFPTYGNTTLTFDGNNKEE